MFNPTIIRHATTKDGFMTVTTGGMSGDVYVQTYKTYSEGYTSLAYSMPWGDETGAMMDFNRLLEQQNDDS